MLTELSRFSLFASVGQVLFTRVLASRLEAEGSKVTAVSLHPGAVLTGKPPNGRGVHSGLVVSELPCPPLQSYFGMCRTLTFLCPFFR